VFTPQFRLPPPVLALRPEKFHSAKPNAAMPNAAMPNAALPNGW